MYIDHIEIENFRTFRKARVEFCHAERDYRKLGLPPPAIPNVNLLLANNGLGKTTLLRAIALAALGPAASLSGIFPYRLIRHEGGRKGKINSAALRADFTTHPQDRAPVNTIESDVRVVARGDLEVLEWGHKEDKAWHPVFSEKTDAFFMVGYGAGRRVGKQSRPEPVGKFSQRASRIMGLFEDDYTLRPLTSWLPKFRESSQLRGRHTQVVNLINRIIAQTGWEFPAEQDKQGEYIMRRGRLEVPVPAMSDGYRAFLGWLGDLLFHVCETCPSGKKLVENRGMVLVDEIDLHLHPKWQMEVISVLAQELPNIQFILTSHSPLVVGSLEWMNIIVMKADENQASEAVRLATPVHGLDADQILLTDFFDLESTRAPGPLRRLKEVALKARAGDDAAADELLRLMSRGSEGGETGAEILEIPVYTVRPTRVPSLKQKPAIEEVQQLRLEEPASRYEGARPSAPARKSPRPAAKKKIAPKPDSTVKTAAKKAKPAKGRSKK
jgi:hypothetical protein